MSRRDVGAARRRRSAIDDTGATRRRILDAARSLLRQGRFQAASMEEIAEEAGLSRAGLYLHFRSRAALIDAICETLDESPELQTLHELVGSGDSRESLHRIIEVNTRFWASDEPMFRQLYGSAAIDAAARDFVNRQTEDRATGVTILTERLAAAGHLRSGLRDSHANALILLITSFSAYLELRRTAGLSAEEVVGMLREVAEQNILEPEA